MINTRLETPGALSVYTWNPPWETFQYLSLQDKIDEFKKFVIESQNHFRSQKSLSDHNAVCLIVAPDLIFAPADLKEGELSPTYSYHDKELFDTQMKDLQSELDHETLVIAGTIEYATKNKSHTKVTSLCLSRSIVKTYDKKNAEEDYKAMIDGEILEMECGNNSGIIHFNGRTIGLEICKDHEEKTLQNELKNHQTVDIHVLLSRGQNKRPNNICSASAKNHGIFIQCEREPGKEFDNCLTKRFDTTDVFLVKKIKPTITSFSAPHIEKNRFNLFNQISKSAPHTKIIDTINLEKIETHFVNDNPDVRECIVELAELSPQKKLINLIHALTLHPAWKLIANGTSSKPEGVLKIEEDCILYDFDNKMLLNIQQDAQKKLDSWSFARNAITTQFYKTLAQPHHNNEEIKAISNQLLAIEKLLDAKYLDFDHQSKNNIYSSFSMQSAFK